MIIRFLSVTCAVLALLWGSFASASDFATTPRIEVRLVAKELAVPASGGTISLALDQRIQPEWHTYWRNPGESGEPTSLAWTLPEGFSASPINWPAPQRIPFGELANYGYSTHVLLRSDITVPAGLKPGDHVTFRVDAAWLICKDICVPEQAPLELTLPVIDGEPQPNEQWREAFADARAREPSPNGPFDARFRSNEKETLLYFHPTGDQAGQGTGAQFFPFSKGLIKASAEQVSEPREGGFSITVPSGWRLRDVEQSRTIDRIDGIIMLAAREGEIPKSYEVSLSRGAVPAPGVDAAAATPLLQAIIFALLGGLILNLMPCVFPILSMKALALVQAGHTRRPWIDGIAYLVGVMTTFAALAGALLWLRSIGEDVGWGFQLQTPLSVVALAYILALIGLNLSGVYSIGTTVQGAGGHLSGSGGLISSFFTGVLAVIVAAPCTAPFMGAAMSYAFTQSPGVTFAIFLALGFGLALPWVIFSFSPALIRLLPKPGAWMEGFKQFLAFPMYGASAWLVWVVSQQVAPEGFFRILIGLVLLALAAWALGIAQSRAALSRNYLLGAVTFLLSATAAIALVLAPFAPPAAATRAPDSTESSEPYSAARLSQLRAEGKPVFVNLTAAWCVSCLYNERVALSSARVRDAFQQTGTAYLVGDWTNRNPEISALLKQHARDGVPLYLYFPRDGGDPQTLPQLLTESLMLETLQGK